MASIKDYVIDVLKKNNIAADDRLHQMPGKDKFLNSSYLKEIESVYHELGGRERALPILLNPYDIQTASAIIQLDNETHYNRYRALTLRSPVYNQISSISVDNFKRYCRQFEAECLKSAGSYSSWSNSESEKHFGESQEIGDLSSPGPSLWKLNAYKNFLTDISCLLSKITLFRISPYDSLMINGKMIKIKELLLKRNPANEVYLFKYIERGIIRKQP